MWRSSCQSPGERHCDRHQARGTGARRTSDVGLGNPPQPHRAVLLPGRDDVPWLQITVDHPGRMDRRQRRRDREPLVSSAGGNGPSVRTAANSVGPSMNSVTRYGRHPAELTSITSAVRNLATRCADRASAGTAPGTRGYAPDPAGSPSTPPADPRRPAHRPRRRPRRNRRRPGGVPATRCPCRRHPIGPAGHTDPPTSGRPRPTAGPTPPANLNPPGRERPRPREPPTRPHPHLITRRPTPAVLRATTDLHHRPGALTRTQPPPTRIRVGDATPRECQ